ncbi:MAG: 4-hydroxy-tetrahydrodipicolinate synthase [Parachlamydiaceae bacterium]
MIKELTGLYTAIITPFNAEGQLDEEGLRLNLRYQLLHEVKGVVILGTTGEAPTLRPDEKEAVIQIAVEELKGKATIIVGTGTYSTETTITATKRAKEIGADAALIVTPYYNRPTQEGIFKHFSAICQAVSFPICLYNIPGRTGQNIQTDTLQRLIVHPSIIGIKEASGNISQISDVIEMARKNKPAFSVLSGDDALTLPVIALGGQGVISVASNLLPGPMRALTQSALNGDFESARNWHYTLLPFLKSNFIETNPIPIKAAMHECGMAAGPCRLPLCNLSPPHLEMIKQVVNSIPHSWLSSLLI